MKDTAGGKSMPSDEDTIKAFLTVRDHCKGVPFEMCEQGQCILKAFCLSDTGDIPPCDWELDPEEEPCKMPQDAGDILEAAGTALAKIDRLVADIRELVKQTHE